MPPSIAGYHEQLQYADRMFTAVFYKALEQARAQYQAQIDLMAMTIQTPGKKSVSHNWIGPVPKMVKWTGSRTHVKLRTDGFLIENEKWANGVEIDGDDIEDDTLGLYTPRLNSLAEEGVVLQWDLIAELLNGGFAGLGYDGVSFFNNAHPNHGNSQDNLDTAALAATSLKNARTRLAQMADEDGRPLNLKPTHLIIEPSNYWTAKGLLEDERLASGATNTTRGLATIVEMPTLTSGYWFLADFSKPLKPFILQNKRGIRSDRLTSPDSPNVYHEDKHFYGASWKGGYGYGLWELIQGSNGTT